MLIGVYILSSLLCFVAASVMMARFNSASADYAQSYLLVTILAAVLGGVDPFGGFGRIARAGAGARHPPGHLLRLQPPRPQPALTLAIWGLTLIVVMAAKRVGGAWRLRSPRPARRTPRSPA